MQEQDGEEEKIIIEYVSAPIELPETDGEAQAAPEEDMEGMGYGGLGLGAPQGLGFDSKPKVRHVQLLGASQHGRSKGGSPGEGRRGGTHVLKQRA